MHFIQKMHFLKEIKIHFLKQMILFGSFGSKNTFFEIKMHFLNKRHL